MVESRAQVSKHHPGSLLSPESSGGVNAGKGFDFQTRYAACHVPVWLLETAFDQLFFEGTGEHRQIHYQERDQSTKCIFKSRTTMSR